MSFLMGAFDYVVPFLVVLTILVFVHELGHYVAARRNGVKVEVFSIGFGPELWGRTDRLGTRWRVSALPFGGYVRMFGDADATSMPGEQLSTMTAEQRAVSLHHKSVAARAEVAAAGPLANLIFAIAILAALYGIVGHPFVPPQIGSIQPGSAAAQAGLQPGDTILSLNGKPVTGFDDLQQFVRPNMGTPLEIAVRRGSAILTVHATPHVSSIIDRLGTMHRTGVLGVTGKGIAWRSVDPLTAVADSAQETVGLVDETLSSVGQMLIGARSTEDLGGPLRIAKFSGEVAQGGMAPIVRFMWMLSVSLAVINLFPIPVLDGGHLLFYAAEAVRGRPLGRRAQEIGFRLGLAFVLSLMVFVTWNDLVQLHVVAFLKGLVT